MWAASEEVVLRDTRRRLQTKPPPRSMRVADAPPHRAARAQVAAARGGEHASAGLHAPPLPPSGTPNSPQRLPPDATTDGKQWLWCSDPPAHPGSTDGTAAFSSAADRAARAAHAEASVATPLQHPRSTVRRASAYCAPAGEMPFGPPRFGRPQLALSPRMVSMTRERPRPPKTYACVPPCASLGTRSQMVHYSCHDSCDGEGAGADFAAARPHTSPVCSAISGESM